MTGDRVAFDKDTFFIGALWNFRYDNVIRFLSADSAGDFLAQVRKYDPKWVAATNGDNQKALRATGEWELVGKISDAGGQEVYRRIRR
jgi:hypothetical protein